MQGVKLICEDQDVIRMFNAAQKFDRGQVLVEQLQQQAFVLRKGIEYGLRGTPLKQTGTSRWSREYGKMIDNIRQSRRVNVSQYLKGSIFLMYDARLRWFEQGYTLHGPSKKGATINKNPQSISATSKKFKGYRFMRAQLRFYKQHATSVFHHTLKRGLEREFKKIQGN